MLSNIATGERYPFHAEMQNIRGKTIVIVGDAAAGGRATAHMLTEMGAKVFIAARNQEELNRLLTEITLSNGRVDGIVCDLSRPEAIRRVFEQAEQRLGRIDVVINYLSDRDDLPVDPEAFQNLAMQYAITHMQDNRKGHIINVGGRQAERTSLIPVTGKVSARGMAAALRRQAKALGIRVTLIEPGAVSFREPGTVQRVISPEDVARCVYDSLIEPAGVDVIFLHGLYSPQQPM